MSMSAEHRTPGHTSAQVMARHRLRPASPPAALAGERPADEVHGVALVLIEFCDTYCIDPLTARRPHIDAWARSLETSGLLPGPWHGVSPRSPAGTGSSSPRRSAPTLLPSTSGAPESAPRARHRGSPGTSSAGCSRPPRARKPPKHRADVGAGPHGMRIGEALSRDVEHLAHDRGHRILRLERKGGHSGRAVLTAPVVRALDAYLDGRETGAIFITKTGRRMDQPEAWRMVRRLARRASLDGAGEIRPHSLRVAFITGAREAGVPLEDVQDAAGHADPRTTRRYDRGRHSLDRHASYAVTAWLTGSSGDDPSRPRAARCGCHPRAARRCAGS